MFRRFSLFLAIFLACQLTEQLRLGFDRTTNIITLFCFNEQDMKINLVSNTSVKFFVNRSTASNQDLGQQVDGGLQISENHLVASFIITRELEGLYSCGTVNPDPRQEINSGTVPFVVLPSSDGFPENSEIYAVQSTDTEVRIPCSFRPGKLYHCYFGTWYKNTTIILSIAKPNADCGSIGPGRRVMNVDENKYRVDEDTFELVISSVTAIADSDQYRCDLWVLNPATTTGHTAQFRSSPSTLVVDGQPNITEAPKDVIIGLDTTGEGLMETATFSCAALGRPVPTIEWLYIVISEDGSLGMPIELRGDKYDIMRNDSDEDPTGRFRTMSTLTMPVTETDGGIIRCKAGTTFADARLTVLSQPAINVITTLRGEIVYDIGLKVHIHHPVKLKLVYVAGGRSLGRDRQPDELFNDTKEIIYRENREQVPSKCRKCHVTVLLTAMLPGGQVMQGLPVTSTDIIDVTQRTPEQKIYGLTIGIAASVTFLLVIIVICVLIIVIIVCVCQKKELRRKHKGKENRTCDKLVNIREDLDNAANFRSPEALNKTVLDKLKKLESFVRTGNDSASPGAAPQEEDLKRINKMLDTILMELPTETAKL